MRRSRGVSTAVMAVLPRCYHLTGPAILPPTPQSCRQWSPWHRHQTAVVTPWDRHVRSDNAVVPPHREEEKCVTGSGKLWQTTGGVTTVMAVLTKNRSGTAPPAWRGYYDQRELGCESFYPPSFRTNPFVFITVMNVISEKNTQRSTQAMLFTDNLLICENIREQSEGQLELKINVSIIEDNESTGTRHGFYNRTPLITVTLNTCTSVTGVTYNKKVPCWIITSIILL